MTIEQILAEEFNLKEDQVVKTVALIDEGNTIPFIARYRRRSPARSMTPSFVTFLTDLHTFAESQSVARR